MNTSSTTPLPRAIDLGDFVEVKRLADLGYAWSISASLTAARKGRLDVLKYAIAHGCPYDGRLMLWAAKHGHLDIIQYGINELGMRCTDSVSIEAAHGNHKHILEWLKETGKPVHSECKWILLKKNPRMTFRLSDMGRK